VLQVLLRRRPPSPLPLPKPIGGRGGSDWPGGRLRGQGLGAPGRADEPPPLWLRLGRLGPDGRPGGAPDRAARPSHRPAPSLPDRPLDGWARDVAARRYLPGPVRRDRAQRRMDQFRYLWDRGATRASSVRYP